MTTEKSGKSEIVLCMNVKAWKLLNKSYLILKLCLSDASVKP